MCEVKVGQDRSTPLYGKYTLLLVVGCVQCAPASFLFLYRTLVPCNVLEMVRKLYRTGETRKTKDLPESRIKRYMCPSASFRQDMI